MKTLTLLTVSLFLTACTLTPAQKAEREAKRVRAEQALQLALAKQCDQEAAELMFEQFNPPQDQTKADEQRFKQRYAKKVGDPMFQACYKMAWQNYQSQQELERLRYRYDNDDFPFWRKWQFCHLCL